MSAIFESFLLKFKPAFVTSPDSPPAIFSFVTDQLKAVPGVESVHLGHPLEKPDHWVLGVRWASRGAHDAFVSSSAATEWNASLRALLAEHPIASPAAQYTGDVDAALAAPITEFCTCWGVDESFTENNMKPFAEACDGGGLAGFHGLAYGQFVQAKHENPQVIPGLASRLLLGWDSKEAHLQHKNVGSVIDDNVFYLLARNKSLEMYHVPLHTV